MIFRRLVITVLVITSLAVGGHAAVSTRGESRSDQALPSQEQLARRDLVFAGYHPVTPSPDIEAQAAHHANRVREIRLWQKAVHEYQWKSAIYAAKLEAARIERIRIENAKRIEHTTKTRSRSVATPQLEASSGRCGGNLPPCYVMMRESGGSLNAENPISTASGKWQILDSTWNGYGGYTHASSAPESVQDAKAALLWSGGNGCSHWSAC